jgi:LysM repeat protein
MSNEPKLHHYERPTESRASERRRHQGSAPDKASKHASSKKGHHASIWASILIIAILVIAIFPLVRSRADHNGSQDIAKSSKQDSSRAVSPRKSKKVQTKSKNTVKKPTTTQQTKQTPAKTNTQAKQPSQSQTKQTNQKNQTSYVVKSGDTLFTIAQSHGTTVDKLVQLNGLSGPDAVQAGQTLKLR